MSDAPTAVLRTLGSTRDTPAFVMVHGVGMSHRSLRPLAAALAAQHEVHLVDLPGFGGLPRPRTDLDIAAMADVLFAALAGAGVEAAVLVGHSMGVQWVLETARRHPDTVAAVALIGPVVDARRRTLRHQAAALAVDTVRESMRVNVRVVIDYVRCGPRWFFRQVRHMLRYDTQSVLADLDRPVLVVRGERDPIARADWAEALAAEAGDGLVVTIGGQAHHAQFTAPRAVADDLHRFSIRAMRRS